MLSPVLENETQHFKTLNLIMYKYFIIIFLLALLSCVNNNGNNQSPAKNDNSEFVAEPIMVDSIELNLEPEGKDQDNLILCAHNSISDSIVLNPIYYINDIATPNSYMVIGNISELPDKLLPKQNVCFKINLGLDSVEYHKNSSYVLTIKGKTKDRNVLFYKKLRLGNRYKINGETILEPDTVILPVSDITCSHE